MPRCSAAACEGSIGVSASAPNPVVTPYIVRPSAIARSITSRAARTRARAGSSNTTGWPPATSTTSSSDSGSPIRTGIPAKATARRGGIAWGRLPFTASPVAARHPPSPSAGTPGDRFVQLGADEVHRRGVVARDPARQAAGGNELAVSGSPLRLDVVVRAERARQEPEQALERVRVAAPPRVGRARFEPARPAGAPAGEDDAGLPGRSERGVDAVEPPDRQQVRGVPARDEHEVLPRPGALRGRPPAGRTARGRSARNRPSGEGPEEGGDPARGIAGGGGHAGRPGAARRHEVAEVGRRSGPRSRRSRPSRRYAGHIHGRTIAAAGRTGEARSGRMGDCTGHLGWLAWLRRGDSPSSPPACSRPQTPDPGAGCRR